jgi:hypothetical protein
VKRLKRFLAVGLCTAAALSIGVSSEVMAGGVGDQCAGDIDGDGETGITDVLALLMNWGPCPDPPSECPADLDGDETVGISDLIIVILDFGCGFTACESDAECDDGDDCTFDICIHGFCLHIPDPHCL